MPGLDSLHRHAHRLLAGMLLSLHAALWSGLDSGVARALLLAHLGLFFLWQPIWRGDRALSAGGIAAVIGFSAAFVWLAGWGAVGLWLLALIGLVAGRSTGSRAGRAAHLLTLLVLLSELIVRAVPAWAGVTPVPAPVGAAFAVLLPVLSVVIALLPSWSAAEDAAAPVDLLRALTASLVAGLLAAGTLLVMYRQGIDYPNAALQALGSIATLLLVLSWLLSPQRGLGGLAQLWERSLLNIGSPLEQWIAELARLADQESDAARFADRAAAGLTRMPWVAGVRWRVHELAGRHGRQTRHCIEVAEDGVELAFHLLRAPGATLMLHARLLAMVFRYFVAAKLREQQVSDDTRIRAIHETGARVTHDIKNLLQSFEALTAAIARDRARRAGQPDDDGMRTLALLDRQLPELRRRLNRALGKLQKPGDLDATRVGLRPWLDRVSAAHAEPWVRFEAHVGHDRALPVGLFDSAVENFIENARNKRASEPALTLTLEVISDDRGLRLNARDSGSPIPRERAATLLRRPVHSMFGLGVGLYQLARQAEAQGYRVELSDNRPGSVCFTLREAPADEAYGS